VIHQRERLPFGFEPGDDTFGVHARLDDFHGHFPPHRHFLFRHEDHAAATLADLFQQLVVTYTITRLLAHGIFRPGFYRNSLRGLFQKISDLIMGFQQGFHLLAQIRISSTGTLQIFCALSAGQLERPSEHFHLTMGQIVH
jgi:hypothetical protein